MSKKNIFVTILITLGVIALYALNVFFESDTASGATSAYRVYLNGESIGLIASKDELYDLINHEQEIIRMQYGVANVYPPDSFDIVKVNTYDNNLKTAEEIYQIIDKRDDFAIEGYIITIKYDPEKYEDGEEVPKDVSIYTLDKETFEAAIEKFIYAFVTEEEYTKYINNTFSEIDDVGSLIESMRFNQNISIKKGYISVKNKIYTKNDITELSQYLLFGKDAKMESYTIALGDTIESISEEYKLNPQEFLIANPTYRDEKTVLKVGNQVNVTLLDPVLEFVYSVYEVSIEEQQFETTQDIDPSKGADYHEISVQGVNGLSKITQTYDVINGEASSEVTFVGDPVTIREKINQVEIIGNKNYGYKGSISGTWAWPTNYPYRITSGYEWRWGKHHDGLDISGTGKGSPIYSVGAGTVVEARDAVPRGYARYNEGTYVVIEHDNNVYSLYAHMNSKSVEVGDAVRKGEQIGTMGETGYATGVHLHFSVSYGWPYHGSYTFINPMRLYR